MGAYGVLHKVKITTSPLAEYNAKNGAALERLVKDQGVVVKEFNDDVYSAFKRGSDEVYAEVQSTFRTRRERSGVTECVKLLRVTSS